jgi:hypothetical protein
VDDDTLEGGDGNDLFFAMGERATLTGNGGVNLFHFSGSGEYTVTDFNAENGDLLSFGGRFEDDLHFLTSMRVENQTEESDGDLVVYDERSELSVRLVDQGGLMTTAEDHVFDFLSKEDRADELSSYFNELNSKQLDAFLDHTVTEGENDLFFGLDGEQFEQFFSPSHAALLVAEYDPDHKLADPPPEEDTASSEDQPDMGEPEEVDAPSPLQPDAPQDDPDALDEIWDEAARLMELLDTLDQYRQQNSNEDEGEDAQSGPNINVDASCFVATAAYRNPSHPDVVYLRKFRDEFLRNWLVGRIFIAFYWTVGPVLARPVRKSAHLASLSVVILKMVIAVIRFIWRK